MRRQNGTGTIRKDGYIQIKIDHPVAGARDFAFLHRVVLYDKIGLGPHLCHYCGVVVNWNLGLECDHVNHDKSDNEPENLVPCCRPCNRSRWNRAKTGCPREFDHGPYDKAYANGHRYCSKCKNEKEKRRNARKREQQVEST